MKTPRPTVLAFAAATVTAVACVVSAAVVLGAPAWVPLLAGFVLAAAVAVNLGRRLLDERTDARLAAKFVPEPPARPEPPVRPQL